MSEKKVELVSYGGYEDYLRVVEESGLMSNAEEIDVVDNDDSEYEDVACANLEIDLEEKRINFSVVEYVRYSQTRYYTIDFDKVNFNNFFISLVKELEPDLLKKTIKKILKYDELKNKFYEFVKTESDKLNDEEKKILGIILAEYDSELASKLLV